MATARQHIANDHQKEHAHWTAFAKGLGELGTHIRAMHKEAGMTGESKPGDACDKLKALAQSHADYHGGAAEECMKAADADRTMPTQVTAVTPTHPGVKVESEFSKLLGLNPEDMHVEEKSLRR
jgi:hypothetical protein